MGRSESQIHRISKQTLKVEFKVWDLPWEMVFWASVTREVEHCLWYVQAAYRVDPDEAPGRS